ncbi:hypothetical protein [Nocardia yunnanensis]|uniref:hypothetical protein n=1 Tax=Nocardia yunnanensis TaxID=2382165 RepID=UPI0013C51189|nr:hypothetical protein [Nocardia yunnanensis]
MPEVAQHVVTQHEYAHHHLQSSSAWGMAMITSAVVDDSGTAASAAWTAFARACRSVHEMFATYFSVIGIDDGLEHYRGNMRYLRYYGLGTALIGGLPLSPAGRKRAIEDLSRALMSPAWLTELTFDQVRRLGQSGDGLPGAPDARLHVLIQSIADESVSTPLARLFEETDDSRDRWDPLAARLSALGIDCPDHEDLMNWTAVMVDGCNEFLPVSIEIEGRGSDPLMSLVENHSRERLRLHSQHRRDAATSELGRTNDPADQRRPGTPHRGTRTHADPR